MLTLFWIYCILISVQTTLWGCCCFFYFWPKPLWFSLTGVFQCPTENTFVLFMYRILKELKVKTGYYKRFFEKSIKPELLKPNELVRIRVRNNNKEELLSKWHGLGVFCVFFFKYHLFWRYSLSAEPRTNSNTTFKVVGTQFPHIALSREKGNQKEIKFIGMFHFINIIPSV